jgi:hypothetical protein
MLQKLNRLKERRYRTMKHLKKFILCSLLLGLFPSTSFSNDFDLDFDSMINDPALDGLTIPADITRTPPQMIIEFIESVNGIALLQQDFYLKTNPLNTRSLLYYPFVQPIKLSYPYDGIIGGHMFYNQMKQSYFTKDSPHITSYLAICQPDFLDLLTESAEQAQMLFNFTLDPLSIFPLFNEATVEQRRIGALFYGSYRFNVLDLRAIIPVYYMERNYIIGLAQREELETQFGASTYDEQQKFQKNHLVSDKFGFGDSRIELDFLLLDREDVALNLGIYSTIPTAVAFGTGGLGSYFEQICPRPTFDFSSLFDDTVPLEQTKEEALITGQNFLLGALDQLSANLLETPLGNGGHFGLGGYLTNDCSLSTMIHRPWAEPIFWTNKVYAEYTFPKRENRFYIKRANPEAFAARNFNDATQAEANLMFLDQEIVNRYYPYVYSTLVFPGVNFEWTSKFSFEGHNGGMFLGNDIWIAGKEKLTDLKTHGQSLAFIDECAAVKPLAFQSKVFGTLFLKANRETKIWTVSFNGDYTYASQGIGKDFTLTLGLETNF